MRTLSRYWADLSTLDFAALQANGDAARTIAVLPVAATEQHGPHLPLGVDTVLVDGIVAAALPDLAVCRSSAELAAAGLFGPGRPHPRFPARIGDYTLLMQPGAIIVDALAGERCDPLIGVHGGLSSGEMRVPLVQLDL